MGRVASGSAGDVNSLPNQTRRSSRVRLLYRIGRVPGQQQPPPVLLASSVPVETALLLAGEACSEVVREGKARVWGCE